MYHFQFADVSCKVQRVGRARGWFFGQIDIFRVAVALSKTVRQRDIPVRVGGWSRRRDLTIRWSCTILISFANIYGRWCGGVGGGGLSERLGHVGSIGASR